MTQDILPATPEGPFELCIIGSGSGLSLIDDDLNGWRIALIDNGTGPTEAFGGTCLNAGCIPTKMFALPARFALAPAEAGLVDVDLAFRGAGFAAIQARTFGRTDRVAEAGLAGLSARPNVHVFRGDATFVDAHTIQVGAQRFSAERIVLAAGSRPRMLQVPGFDDPYLDAFVHTSDDILRRPELPRQLIILGGGVEAVEFAHIFAALGVRVQVIGRGPVLLRRFDTEVAAAATRALAERVVLRLNQRVTALEPADAGGVVVTCQDQHDIEYTYQTDAVLVCTGRIPNGDQLRLARAGLALDEAGFVPVDEYLRTPVRHIWALGDVCSPPMLKHLANQQARVVKQNLLAERDRRPLATSREAHVPQGVFGDPEIAFVGATEQQLIDAGVDYVSSLHRYEQVAYGWATNDRGHFVKLLGDRSGRILGAHLIGPHASILLQPILSGLAQGLDAQTIARSQYWIHPALGEVVENALLGLAAAGRPH